MQALRHMRQKSRKETPGVWLFQGRSRKKSGEGLGEIPRKRTGRWSTAKGPGSHM
jgi:hypothetical protein